MAFDLALRSRWLAAMRTSTARATGRECDYAMSEGDVDTFDPIGLLALAAGHSVEGNGFWQFYCGVDGAYVAYQDARALAQQVGFPPALLLTLCYMNDAGVPWSELAGWVEAQCDR